MNQWIKRIDDEDDEIARDGQGVRVPLIAMDAQQRAIANFSAADEAYDDMCTALGDAWKKPGAVEDTRVLTEDKAHAEYTAWLNNAWKGGRA